MPIAALIEDKILCMHGGISPELTKLSKIMGLARPTDIPAQGLLCDLLWADPVEEARGWHENSERGISYLFGADVLAQFLKSNSLDLICRSHQVSIFPLRLCRRGTSSLGNGSWSRSSRRPTTADSLRTGAQC